MNGLRTANEKKIACRTCKYAIKAGIGKMYCNMYKEKPDNVYFNNEECAKYEQGEDLLKYEIQI
ncbi:MAG: hypothetical protein GYA50_05375 [Eubacteriaceae bacterium]|nr:hypothetical protein [Eubacteriaceae bacterium]